MSYTIKLELPDSIHDSLLKKAERSGLSPEALITELIKTAVEDETDDPLEDFIGAIESGGSDWLAQHDYYIGQSAIDDHQSSTN